MMERKQKSGMKFKKKIKETKKIKRIYMKR